MKNANYILRFISVNVPYIVVALTIHEYFPNLITPSFILLLCIMSFVQTALVMHGDTFWMRLSLMYMFVLLIFAFILNIATQFVTGNDLFKIARTFMKVN
jgi:hypothetical protein